jgi:hypothetical protein
MNRPSITAAYREARDRQAAINSENRALVLRYPDIAKRLRDPPYSASDPRNWTGYIPGALGAENARGQVQLNVSPVRAQLADILQAAAEAADADNAPF